MPLQCRNARSAKPQRNIRLDRGDLSPLYNRDRVSAEPPGTAWGDSRVTKAAIDRRTPKANARSLKLENREGADQLDHPALRLMAARADIFSRQGRVDTTWRRREGKTFGPYYRLSYREGGRQRSLYLGGAGALVERVRRALRAAQRPVAEHRTLDRLRRQIRVSLRTTKHRVAALLRPLGLRLKGFEVRGWRLSPLRRLFPCRRFRPANVARVGAGKTHSKSMAYPWTVCAPDRREQCRASGSFSGKSGKCRSARRTCRTQPRLSLVPRAAPW
jgi:hypothetical protein